MIERNSEIWARVDKLKEKYPTSLKREESKTIQSAKEIIKSLLKDNFISGTWQEMVASLVVCGALQFGCAEKSIEKIVSWINEIIDMTPKKTQSYFSSCWRNLEKNGVFKRGKIHANLDGEEGGIELCLLICLAQGYVERVSP